MIKGVLPGIAVYGVLNHPDSVVSAASYVPGLVGSAFSGTWTVGGLLYNLVATGANFTQSL